MRLIKLFSDWKLSQWTVGKRRGMGIQALNNLKTIRGEISRWQNEWCIVFDKTVMETF